MKCKVNPINNDPLPHDWNTRIRRTFTIFSLIFNQWHQKYKWGETHQINTPTTSSKIFNEIKSTGMINMTAWLHPLSTKSISRIKKGETFYFSSDICTKILIDAFQCIFRFSLLKNWLMPLIGPILLFLKLEGSLKE